MGCRRDGTALTNSGYETWIRVAVWRLLSGLNDARAGPWLAQSQARVLEMAGDMARSPDEVDVLIQRVHLFKQLMEAKPPVEPEH